MRGYVEALEARAKGLPLNEVEVALLRRPEPSEPDGDEA